MTLPFDLTIEEYQYLVKIANKITKFEAARRLAIVEKDDPLPWNEEPEDFEEDTEEQFWPDVTEDFADDEDS